jgi:hypothetical protein
VNTKPLPFLSITTLVLGMAGCAGLDRGDPDSPHWLPPVGTLVELHEALEVPPLSARVFLQQGTVLAKPSLNLYLPSCAFAVTRVFEDGSQTIEPDTFQVVRVTGQLEEVVRQRAPAQYAAIHLARGGIDGGSSMVMHVVHLWLESPEQAEVRRLSCRGAMDDPPLSNRPSVTEMRQALGAIATLKLPE